MTDFNKIGFKTIQPIITQDIFKVFEEEMKVQKERAKAASSSL